MGIIKAITGAIGGTLADQWAEVIEPYEMSDTTVFTKGVMMRKDDKRSSNKKGSTDVISDGSVIHVYDNQMMLLADGGKIVDFTAEPGYYKVDNGSQPSLFHGSLDDVIDEAFRRFQFGGVPSTGQKAYYINLQEIKGIKFGTKNPINYFDNFYNAELFLRAHGTYSIRIVNPILFYQEAVPRNMEHVDIKDINTQYLAEFMEALQAAINQLSADGERISHVTAKGRELSKYMSRILDEEWRSQRGMEIQSVGIASISYDDESTKLINMRNQGAMLGDPNVREGYVQGAAARGMEAAGSNAGGAMAGFMGMGMASNIGGGFLDGASKANMSQMQAEMEAELQKMKAQMQAMEQSESSGTGTGKSSGTFSTVSGGNAAGQGGLANQDGAEGGAWACNCGQTNTGNFCSNCGAANPSVWKCACGQSNNGNFCANCGAKRP